MTDAERKLWSKLRADQLGVHFRRQVPFGPYILDFLSVKVRIAVEVDGSQHYSREGLERDIERDMFVGNHGVHVLRFTDVEVLQNLNGVMEKIHSHIQQSKIL